MKVRSYNIFISHAWAYSDQYKELITMLDRSHCFHYRNYSSPQDKPLIEPSIYSDHWLLLKQKIKHQIMSVHTVLVIAGTYYNYRDWMQIEMDITRKYNKPLIAICPLGQDGIPQEIHALATEVVSWNSFSIINSIRNHANFI